MNYSGKKQSELLKNVLLLKTGRSRAGLRRIRRRFYAAVRIVEWFTGYGTYETTPGSYYGADGGG